VALLEGKCALVVGVANKRSIAWGIAQAFHREGADLVLTYQNERLRENVEKLAELLDRRPPLLELDVADDDHLARLGPRLAAEGKTVDVIVHAVAHARREDLDGLYVDTARAGFREALEISAYSLVALVRAVRPVLSDQASVLTLTYLGSERVAPNYNVMGVAKAALEASVRYLAAELGPEGVRVNAISSGPIKTLAASGVRGFSSMLHLYEEKTPLKRTLTAEDVGDAAVFLASPLARAVTGTVLYVDNGYHILAV
jgi:enoyl-[acyl-carrier protein] reductase I